jgi:hypothetical protein
MPEPRYRAAVRGLALDVVWSLWTELGSSGWSRRHPTTAIDLEPLMIATATISRSDARLREEALDWCVANSRFVSAVRLRNSLKAAPPDVRDAFSDFSETVKRHVRVPWPGGGSAYPFVPTGRGLAPDLARPALLQLRLRAIVGVSVRAEILRLMLAEPARLYSAAELASASAYGKGIVNAALEPLAMAGIIEVQVAGNQFRHRLARVAQLAKLVEPLPLSFPDWQSRFRVIHAIAVFTETAPPTGMPRAVEARRTIRTLDSDLRRLSLIGSVPAADGEALAGEFERWSLDVLGVWAGAREAPNQA